MRSSGNRYFVKQVALITIFCAERRKKICPEKGQSIGIWQRIIKLSVRCRIQLVACKPIECQFSDRKKETEKGKNQSEREVAAAKCCFCC